MPLLNDDYVEPDNFYEALTNLKNQNLNNLRNSVVDAPGQPIMPMDRNPNEMESFKEEIIANKQIQAEREEAWSKWRTKRELSKLGEIAPLAIGGYIVYKFFL